MGFTIITVVYCKITYDMKSIAYRDYHTGILIGSLPLSYVLTILQTILYGCSARVMH